MDILKKEMGEINLTPYDEKIKNKKIKNAITQRWRKLGLLDGIQQNSKTEKLIIEMYERMSIYLLSTNNVSEWFITMIFPLIRLLYTGEKSCGKKINFAVMPDVLYTTLSNIRMDAIKIVFEKNVPKSVFNRKQALFNLIEYKHLSQKNVTELKTDDFILTTEEISLLTALYPNKYKTQFDFEAEVFALINSCCVFILKEAHKQNI